jgi:COMPASS component SWD2
VRHAARARRRQRLIWPPHCSEAKVVHSKKHGVDLIRYTHATNNVICASRPESVDRTLRYLSVYDNKYIHYFKGHQDRVIDLCMCPLNDTFVSAALDRTVRLWDTVSGKCMATLQGHSDAVWSVCFSPDGTLVASASNDKIVRL